MFLNNIVISKHANLRFCERKCTDTDVKQFFKHLKESMCVLIYDMVIAGCVNGIPHRVKIGNTIFVLTFDMTRTKIVLKTMWRLK